MRATLVVALVLVGVASAAQKHCVFLHGAGNLDAGPPTSSFTDYWGDMNSATPQCASWTYNHADTVTNRFDNTTLMQSYCDVATGGAGSVVKNTIVFTHSMGNNIFAAAMRAGLCSLDGSSTWYLSAPPGRGSKAADMVEEICSSQSWLDDPIRDIATLFHYCQNDQPGPANAAYVSLQTTDPSLVGLAEQWMAPYASGVMCGTSAFGLVSEYSLGLEALSALVNYGEPNDGMVAQSSCFVGNFTFGGDASAPYYLAAVNHADATGRDGNGDFGADRQPLKWFGQRV